MKTTKQLLIAMLMIINHIDLSAAKKEPNVINAVKNSLILPTHYFETNMKKKLDYLSKSMKKVKHKRSLLMQKPNLRKSIF
jgi:hypothetical protein